MAARAAIATAALIETMYLWELRLVWRPRRARDWWITRSGVINIDVLWNSSTLTELKMNLIFMLP